MIRSKNAEQLAYYLWERRPDVSYDVASEGEDNGEEIEEELLDEQSADEDADFDILGRQDVEEDDDEEPQPLPRRPGRRRSIVKGKNNFRWSINAPEIRGRHSLKVYLPSAKGVAKDVTTSLVVIIFRTYARKYRSAHQ